MKSYHLIPFLFITISSYAQKLPDVQQVSLNAPYLIKIDEKVNTLHTFTANNNRNELIHAIVNDDKNPYLVINSVNNDATSKIIGGISFTIDTTGKRRYGNVYIITYPKVNRASRINRKQRNVRGFWRRSQQRKQQRGSATIANIKSQLAIVKEIKLDRFKLIPDTSISIYNEYSIKVANSDVAGIYVYEIAILLLQFYIAKTKGKESAYQIKLNEMSFVRFCSSRNSDSFAMGVLSSNIGNFNRGGQDLFNPTDFGVNNCYTKTS